MSYVAGTITVDLQHEPKPCRRCPALVVPVELTMIDAESRGVLWEHRAGVEHSAERCPTRDGDVSWR